MTVRVSIGAKLVLGFLAVGLLPLIALGFISLITSSKALSTQSFNQLEAVRAIKKGQIESFFEERRGDMGVLMETVSALRLEAFNKLEAIQELKKAQLIAYFADMKNKLRVLKDDPFAGEALLEFNRAFEEGGDRVDTPEWLALAKQYEKRMKDILDDNGWYDIFLIHTDGDVVYTVTRESDLGMIIPDSELKDSPLGKAFSKAIKMGPEDIAVADFAPYAPSNGAPAGFMMAQMRDEFGTLQGYVAFQIPLDKINEIMLLRNGMGQTGESYLVGQDGLMRSDSYLDPDGHSVAASFKNKTKVDTEATRRALAGEEGQGVIADYNSNPVLSAWDLVDIGDGIKWAMMSEIDVAEAFSPVDKEGREFYAKYVEMYGYYDLFLINPDGYCFYSVAREPEYQTNLVNGKYADSGLGKLVRETLETGKFGLADFAPYAPSNGDPAAFIAQPLIHNGEVETIVALQISLEAIDKIMQQREGMGQTGETYLVGPDYLMRSDSYLDPTYHSVKASFANPAKGRVETDAAKAALAGQTGTEIITDYNGNPVLSAYTPVQVGNVVWALLAEIDEAEAFAALTHLRWLMLLVGCIGVAAIVAFALILARTITRPVKRAMALAEVIQQGDLTNRLNMTQADEIGQMARSLDSMADGLEAKSRLAERIAAGDLTEDVELASEKDTLGHSLQAMIANLNKILGEVNSAAQQVTGGTTQVSDSSQALSQGATEQAASIQEITSSMTELASQTRSNAENAGQANELALGASASAETGNSRMREMIQAMSDIESSSQEIAKIIKAIDDIAFQTNLLALNAAVEAARAGKHGKGFAVVAQEVRNLAGRSARAAQETAELIETSVKNVASGVEIVNKTAGALGEIADGASKVAHLVGEIATASNEQALGISQINQGLSQIEQVTQQNTASAEQTASAAEELSSQAVQLSGLVAQFKLKADRGHALTRAVRPSSPALSGDTSWGSPQAQGQRHSAFQSKQFVSPETVIALDDGEYGKY